MLIDKAWKMLELAKDGNRLSEECFNTWAEKNSMPKYPSPDYDKVKTYDDFYKVAYYHIFGN